MSISPEISDPILECLLRDDVNGYICQHEEKLATAQDDSDPNSPTVLILGGNYLDPRSRQNSPVEVYVCNVVKILGNDSIFIEFGGDSYALEPGSATNKGTGAIINPKQFDMLRLVLRETDWDGGYSAELAEDARRILDF